MSIMRYNYNVVEEHPGLGQSTGYQVGTQVAATAASFVPVVGPVLGPAISFFSKLFGGSEQKVPSRPERAAGTLQALAHVLVNFPKDFESWAMSVFNTLFTVGTYEHCVLFHASPQSLLQTFSGLSTAPFIKQRAMQRMSELISEARAAMQTALTDTQWLQAYQVVGLAGIKQAAQTKTGPGSGQYREARKLCTVADPRNMAEIIASQLTESQIAAIGATPVTTTPAGPAAIPTPTTEMLPSTGLPWWLTGQPAPTTPGAAPVTQAGIVPANLTPFLLLGGLFALPFIIGTKKERRYRRKQRLQTRK